MDVSPSEKSVGDKDTKNDFSNALNLMIQGKRHLMIDDFQSATQCLEDACRLYDEKYGANADECGDPYMYYGISLLELSRQEMGAFNGVVNAKVDEPGESEDEDEDVDGDEEGGEGEENDNEKEAEKKAEDSVEKEGNGEKCDSKESAPSKEEKTENTEVENADTEDEIVLGAPSPTPFEKENEPEALAKESLDKLMDLDQPGTSAGPSTSEPKKEEEEEAEASTIEVSWEVLTMASEIFKKQLREGKGRDIRLKLAEALQKLGEIAIEWENNSHALELFGESLAIRKDSLPDDDRMIAETYYHIGIAHSFMSMIDEANMCFRLAIQVIQKRIDKFEDILKTSIDDDAKAKAEKEVRELKDVLPDMVAKIEDSKDQMSSAQKVAEALHEDDEKLSSGDVPMKGSPVKPVNNVSHLIKRKKCDVEQTESKTKKMCTLTTISTPSNTTSNSSNSNAH